MDKYRARQRKIRALKQLERQKNQRPRAKRKVVIGGRITWLKIPSPKQIMDYTEKEKIMYEQN